MIKTNLQTGDIVRHKGTGDTYVIMQVHNYGTKDEHYSAVKPVCVSNMSEWDIIYSGVQTMHKLNEIEKLIKSAR